MRQLKFRAWHTKLGHYLKDNEFYINSDGSVYSAFESYDNKIRKTDYIENFSRDDFDEGYIIVDQCTGLKDKNGKEIFEGDIVEFGLSGRPERGYVAYADEYASFEVYSKRDFIFGGLFGKAGEVIGNIHENGDLLEEK